MCVSPRTRRALDFFDARPGLKDLKLASGPLANMTVGAVLAAANATLNGAAPPNGLSIANFDNILAKINQNYLDGVEDHGLLKPW